MRSGIKTNSIILLIASIISFSGLLYILYKINTNLVVAINIYHTEFNWIHVLMASGHIFVFLFHFYALISLFIHFRHFKALRPIKIVLLMLGVFSLLAIGVEKVMIDEIAREYRLGWDIGEIVILNSAYIMNMIFSILIFVFLLRTFKLIHLENAVSPRIDEDIFIIAQCLGVFSGLTGLLFTLHMIRFVSKDILADKYWVFIPFYILFLIPYGLAVCYWLVLKMRQRIPDWYDEKQIQDMSRSALLTLLLSVPGIAVLLFFQVPHSVFYLIYYVFMILFLFSGSTLYHFKIKDAV